MWVYFLLAVLIVAVDQVTKFWVVSTIPLDGFYPLLDGVVHLTNLHNTGAAFSMFSESHWVLFGVSLVLIVCIVVFLARSGSYRPIQRVCAACVLGGAIGNAIDRGLLGYVVDMICVDFVEFAVFNVADCFITCGGILFCILYIAFPPAASRLERRPKMQEIQRLREPVERTPISRVPIVQEPGRTAAPEQEPERHDPSDS